VPSYVLDHHREGERQRLALMSRLLDPMHRRHIEQLGAGPGARGMEAGCGNGSISAWLAERVFPGGRVVAVDLDLSLVSADVPGTEFRQADILAGPVEPRGFDLVTARAVLHHVADADAGVRNLVASARPGGAVLLIEPDFLPVSIAEPAEVRAFWQGWLAWSHEQGIDYFIGRRLPSMLSSQGLADIRATAETALYSGGSPWATYWKLTVTELRPSLVASGKLDDRLVDAFLARCDDPGWWTQTISFTAVSGRVPGG
jgi:SAM-dependent methyltransferase